MFNKMIIEDVTFNEVDTIAVEAFIESFVKTVGMKTAVKDGKTYIIDKGRTTVVDSDYVIDMVKSCTVGKTLEEVERNSRVSIAIDELSLVKKLVLKEAEETKTPNLFE